MAVKPVSSPVLQRLRPGDRIRVTQTIRGRDRAWTAPVEGVVEACRREPTGSWFAHGHNARFWLIRVRLKKNDGEVTSLILDQHTRVEVLETADQG